MGDRTIESLKEEYARALGVKVDEVYCEKQYDNGEVLYFGIQINDRDMYEYCFFPELAAWETLDRDYFGFPTLQALLDEMRKHK